MGTKQMLSALQEVVKGSGEDLMNNVTSPLSGGKQHLKRDGPHAKTQLAELVNVDDKMVTFDTR